MTRRDTSDRRMSSDPFGYGPRRSLGGLAWVALGIFVPSFLLFVVLVVVDHMKG